MINRGKGGGGLSPPSFRLSVVGSFRGMLLIPRDSETTLSHLCIQGRVSFRKEREREKGAKTGGMRRRRNSSRYSAGRTYFAVFFKKPSLFFSATQKRAAYSELKGTMHLARRSLCVCVLILGGKRDRDRMRSRRKRLRAPAAASFSPPEQSSRRCHEKMI